MAASLHLSSCSCVAKEIRGGDQIKSKRKDGRGLTLKRSHVCAHVALMASIDGWSIWDRRKQPPTLTSVMGSLTKTSSQPWEEEDAGSGRGRSDHRPTRINGTGATCTRFALREVPASGDEDVVAAVAGRIGADGHGWGGGGGRGWGGGGSERGGRRDQGSWGGGTSRRRSI